jgi:hypothetical protein
MPDRRWDAPDQPADSAPAPGLPVGIVLPDYAGASLDQLTPALLRAPGKRPGWLPAALAEARQIVLLVLDGLGWEQLQARPAVAPTLAAMEGGPISSVAPTTTATALSSITLGVPPAVHGVVGYKLRVEGPTGSEVLNLLRWRTPSGDARPFLDPAEFQVEPAFGGRLVPVVSRREFVGTGFSAMHQRGTRDLAYLAPSSMAPLVRRLLGEGEPFVYAYYDGVDKMAHGTGLGELYDAELTAADRLVADLAAALPPGAALVVTADHGQVEVGPGAEFLDDEVLAHTVLVSGEARFRWLHARPGQETDLLAAARHRYGSEAWVTTAQELDHLGVFGAPLDRRARERLGDVVLIPLGSLGYLDPADAGDAQLVCRHGGLSGAEIWVPLVAIGV